VLIQAKWQYRHNDDCESLGSHDDAYARIWKEAVMVYFKVISPHLLTGEETSSSSSSSTSNSNNNNNNKIMIAVSWQILELINL
jgi:hypothetical protein